MSFHLKKQKSLKFFKSKKLYDFTTNLICKMLLSPRSKINSLISRQYFPWSKEKYYFYTNVIIKKNLRNSKNNFSNFIAKIHYSIFVI